MGIVLFQYNFTLKTISSRLDLARGFANRCSNSSDVSGLPVERRRADLHGFGKLLAWKRVTFGWKKKPEFNAHPSCLWESGEGEIWEALVTLMVH